MIPSLLQDTNRLKIELSSDVTYWSRIVCINPKLNPQEKSQPALEYICDRDQIFPFVIGPENTCQLNGMTHREILMSVGYEVKWLNRKISNELEFYLVIFREDKCFDATGTVPVNATWEGIFHLIKMKSQTCADKLLAVWENIKQIPCELDGPIDQVSPEEYAVVGSFEGFANFEGEITAALGRKFLRHTMKCTSLYRGDGYAYSQNGERGVKEYLMPRVKVANLEPIKVEQLLWEPENIDGI